MAVGLRFRKPLLYPLSYGGSPEGSALTHEETGPKAPLRRPKALSKLVPRSTYPSGDGYRDETDA